VDSSCGGLTPSLTDIARARNCLDALSASADHATRYAHFRVYSQLGVLERCGTISTFGTTERQFVIASGIEFKDFLPHLGKRGGVALLDHQSDAAADDTQSGFGYIKASDLPAIAAEDIYSWGNFVWADYTPPQFPAISDQELAELLFFARKARPLGGVGIPSLQNHFLAYAHDDGWYLQLYYSNWSQLEDLLSEAIPASLGPLNLRDLEQGMRAYWLCDGDVFIEERTEDVDAVLNRHR